MSSAGISREMKDGALGVIGPQAKLQFLKLFQTEARSSKQEQKLLALSSFRLFILTSKMPVKMDQSYNFMEITGFESNASNKLIIFMESKKLSLQSISADDIGVEELMFVILESLANAFPGIPAEKLISKMDLNPNTRQSAMYDRLTEVSKPFTPCGNLSVAYMFMSDRLGVPFMDEVIWDIDTICQSQNTQELALVDFEHLDIRYVIPIVAALRHNQWFTKLNVSSTKLTTEMINEILEIMKTNVVIRDLAASATGVKADFVQKLVTSLMSNKNCALARVDLSANVIEDRGINFLCSATNILCKLTSLDLASCNLTSKAVGKLFDVLFANKPSPLTSLNLSDNLLRDEIPSFHKFLSLLNSLTILKLSGTECCLEQLFGPLSQGCCQNLVHLDLSRNVYTSKKSGKDSNVTNSCSQFFSKASALQFASLASSKLTPDAIKQILQGLAANNHLKSLELNLSGNSLGIKGACALESFLPSVFNISSLDISDNGFEQALESVTSTIMKTSGMKKLCLGKNFIAIRPKSMPKALTPLVDLLQSDTTTIESLMLDDLKLKTATNVVLNALGTNVCLKEIDLSGNQMGDIGIRMLAKALQINNHLTTIYLDGNNTSPNGFAYLALAVNMNFTLTKMPTPLLDVAAAVKINQEKTFQALKDIENVLHRNRNPKVNTSDQNYRLQQCFLSGTAQQDLDRLVTHLQDLVRYLRRFDLTNEELNHVNEATKLFREAQSVSAIFMLLHKVASGLESDNGAICTKLSTIVPDIEDVIGRQLKIGLDDSIKSLQESYPMIFKKSTLQDELKSYCLQQCILPKDFVGEAELQNLKVSVVNKVSSLQLSMNTFMVIQLVEEMMKRLDAENQTLNQVVIKYQNLSESKKTSSNGEAISASSDNAAVARNGSVVRGKSGNLPNLRKSMHGRMLRPLTEIDMEDNRDSNGSDCTSPSETKERSKSTDSEVHKFSQQPTSKFTAKQVTASESDLEFIKREGPKLDHKSKSRPMRTKTKVSHSPNGILARNLAGSLGEEDDNVTDDEDSSDAVFSPVAENNNSHVERKYKDDVNLKTKDDVKLNGKQNNKISDKILTDVPVLTEETSNNDADNTKSRTTMFGGGKSIFPPIKKLNIPKQDTPAQMVEKKGERTTVIGGVKLSSSSSGGLLRSPSAAAKPFVASSPASPTSEEKTLNKKSDALTEVNEETLQQKKQNRWSASKE